ncbi:MAG TPA: exodeoxyribonuclease VII small subunit [Anaerolineales bacterium]
MVKNDQKPIKGLTYEAAFAELETIVTELETGEKPLEESMLLFERGQALIKHCAEMLEKAELKVQTLTGEAPDGLKDNE